MANLYSTEEAAQVLGIAPRTVAAQFDSGRLGGFRDPISAVRRIRKEDILKWLRERNLPIPGALATPVNDIQTR
jgi:excisionase family DNA binding protein